MRRTILLLTVMGAAMLLVSGPSGLAQTAGSTSEATFEISHGSTRTIKTASTYTAKTFKIANKSPDGQEITSLSLDVGTALLPDLVLDPVGTAGDDVGKCFTADEGASTVGLVAPADPCSDPFSQLHDGGYDVLTLDFRDFDPGETFKFSMDGDPTSINGVDDPGPNSSGSVSGLELTGSNVTVGFDDGTSRTAKTFRIPNSPHSSRNTLKAGTIPEPSISVLGVTAPSRVTEADQTVRVSGPAGSTVSLLVLEGGLFTDGVPNGGYDLDPYEANSALAVTEKSAQIGSGGTVDVPVTLTRSDPEHGGLNYIVAVIKDATGRSGLTSNVQVLELGGTGGGTGGCTVSGTAANDSLVGTEGDDVICGLGGNDTIKGLGGNDILEGGDGKDKLLGGEGDDTIDGGTGADSADYSGSAAGVDVSLATNTASGGEGSDTLSGIENLTGSRRADELTGSDEGNVLNGLGGSDTLRGGSGNDTVIGGGGADKLYGEDGDDAVKSKDGVSGNDSLDGGPGADTKVTDATEKSIVGFP